MKQLFGTADLEAEIFQSADGTKENIQEVEYDLDGMLVSDIEDFQNLSEEDTEDFPALELTLELTDGRILEYEVAAVFVHEDKEYVGLHPKSDTEGLIHIMQLLQGEDDEIELLPIKEEEELIAVYDTFFKLYGKQAIAAPFRGGSRGASQAGRQAANTDPKQKFEGGTATWTKGVASPNAKRSNITIGAHRTRTNQTSQNQWKTGVKPTGERNNKFTIGANRSLGAAKETPKIQPGCLSVNTSPKSAETRELIS